MLYFNGIVRTAATAKEDMQKSELESSHSSQRSHSTANAATAGELESHPASRGAVSVRLPAAGAASPEDPLWERACLQQRLLLLVLKSACCRWLTGCRCAVLAAPSLSCGRATGA